MNWLNSKHWPMTIHVILSFILVILLLSFCLLIISALIATGHGWTSLFTILAIYILLNLIDKESV